MFKARTFVVTKRYTFPGLSLCSAGSVGGGVVSGEVRFVLSEDWLVADMFVAKLLSAEIFLCDINLVEASTAGVRSLSLTKTIFPAFGGGSALASSTFACAPPVCLSFWETVFFFCAGVAFLRPFFEAFEGHSAAR